MPPCMSHDSYRFGVANGINEYFFEPLPSPSARLLAVSNRRLTSLCLVEVSLNCSSTEGEDLEYVREFSVGMRCEIFLLTRVIFLMIM